MKYIKFETNHCPMCKQMGKMLDQIGVKYTKVDCESNFAAVEEFGIKAVPMLVRLTDAGIENGRTGFVGIEELKKFVGK